jgi:4-amino-4-deoxychorismate lyase
MTLLALAVAGRGLVDPDAPVFQVDDEAVVRGSAAFETLPVWAGQPFLLDRHLARLRRSVELLGLTPVADGEVEELVALLLGAVHVDHVVRVYRSSRSLVATAAALPGNLEEQRATGIGLMTVETGVPPAFLAGAKATSYALAFAAVREAERRGLDDVVFLGGGVVLESATSNVWWREGQTLFSPEPGPGVLPGVTRSVVAELARELRFEVREGAFPAERLAAAEEAFTTSSIREVVPVVSLDGLPIGDGSPGPAAASLQGALRLRSGRE